MLSEGATDRCSGRRSSSGSPAGSSGGREAIGATRERSTRLSHRDWIEKPPSHLCKRSTTTREMRNTWNKEISMKQTTNGYEIGGTTITWRRSDVEVGTAVAPRRWPALECIRPGSPPPDPGGSIRTHVPLTEVASNLSERASYINSNYQPDIVASFLQWTYGEPK